MKLIIPGEPIAQIRMKYSGRNGIGRIYDTRQKQKKELKSFIADKFSNNNCFHHPRVSFVFHMSIPKNIPKYLLPVYQSGLLKHEKKPDVDNFVKLFLDCLDEICFQGDQKVSLGNCLKLYHPYPKTIVIISETEQTLTPLEVDPVIWQALFSEESDKCSFFEKASLPYFYSLKELERWQSHYNSFLAEKIPASLKSPPALHP